MQPLSGLGLRPSGYDPTRRVQGSKVVVHVKSESIIDKPREKPNRNRDRQALLAPVEKNCAAKLVNAYKQW